MNPILPVLPVLPSNIHIHPCQDFSFSYLFLSLWNFKRSEDKWWLAQFCLSCRPAVEHPHPPCQNVSIFFLYFFSSFHLLLLQRKRKQYVQGWHLWMSWVELILISEKSEDHIISFFFSIFFLLFFFALFFFYFWYRNSSSSTNQ